jgi:predicted phage terminase large subunit-like protein
MSSISKSEVHAVMRNDFTSFFERFWLILNGAGANFDSPYLAYLAARLQHFEESGQLRLAVFAPPRHGKSTMVSVLWAAWRLGRNPKLRIVCLSHDLRLAIKLHNDMRRLMDSPLYREVFPDVAIVKSNEDAIVTKQGGFREARSLSSGMTGGGGDIFIVDDPIAARDVSSEAMREKCLEDFNYLITRLDQPKSTQVLLVMQRLHVDDCGGYVKCLPDWETITLPLYAMTDEEWCVGCKLFYRRPQGQYLDIGRIGPEEAERTKREIGTAGFLAQYMQAPIPEGGGVIQWDWFQFYDKPPNFSAVFQSWDVATTMSGGNYSACVTFGYADEKFYIIDVFRAQIDMPGFLKLVRKLDAKFHPILIGIEDVGPGKAATQMLIHEGMKNVTPCGVKGSKEERMDRITPMLERGEVFLPRSAPWLDVFREEILGFPKSIFTDQADAFSQFLGQVGGFFRIARIEAPERYRNILKVNCYTIGRERIIDRLRRERALASERYIDAR